MVVFVFSKQKFVQKKHQYARVINKTRMKPLSACCCNVVVDSLDESEMMIPLVDSDVQVSPVDHQIAAATDVSHVIFISLHDRFYSTDFLMIIF